MGRSWPARTRGPDTRLLIATVVALVGLSLSGCASLRRTFGGSATIFGYVEVRLVPETDAPSGEELGETRAILADRLEAAGMADVRVSPLDDTGILVVVEGTADRVEQEQRLRRLVARGELRFRPVLAQTTDTAGTESSASALASAQADTGAEPDKETVIAKLGDAYTLATRISDTANPEQLDESWIAGLQPFALLTPAEVAVLPPAIQFKVPTISCAQLLARPVRAISDPDQPAVACEAVNSTYLKYSLGVSAVSGEDVESATSAASTEGGWAVTLTFTEDGQQRWTSLTAQVQNGDAQVALVLDTRIASAPTIDAVIVGDAEISGWFTEAEARELAAEIEYGALPVALVVASIIHTT